MERERTNKDDKNRDDNYNNNQKKRDGQRESKA